MSAPPRTDEGHGRRPHRHRPGTSPGTLCTSPDAHAPVLTAYVYGPDGLAQHQPRSAAEATALRKPGHILWLDVAGLADLALLQELGDRFGLHRLALEDVTSSQQRAKAEEYPNHAFLVLRMANPGEVLDTEQWSLCLGGDFVLTFQERPGDCFGLVRQRLADPAGRLRTLGPDYLAYALLDAIVDAYFPVLERVGDRLDEIEEDILTTRKDGELVGELHDVRRDLLVLRRALWPLREVTNALLRGDLPRFAPETRVYLRDVHDHAVQLLDLLENFRELGTGLMEVHLSVASQRLNEVMKVLTVIATIFIPLTFVVGVYGMNFHHMPELDWTYGYAACWGLMLLIAIGMLIGFRRRGWI